MLSPPRDVQIEWALEEGVEAMPSFLGRSPVAERRSSIDTSRYRRVLRIGSWSGFEREASGSGTASEAPGRRASRMK